MSFADPMRLYALLVFPLVLLLAFLSKRERRHLVASLTPWRIVLALPRPRPRRNPVDLETVCTMLAPVLAALALAGPILHLPQARMRKLVVVVDTSLSMQSQAPARPSRLEQASAWLPRLMPPDATPLVQLYVTATPAPVAASEEVAALQAALEHAPVSVQDESQAAAVLGAALSASAAEDLPVVWISDRPAPLSNPRLSEILVGDDSQNVGLLHASITLVKDQPRLFAAVGRFDAAPPQKRSLRLAWSATAAGRRVALGADSVALKPGEVRAIEAPLALPPTVDPDAPITLSLQGHTSDETAGWSDDLAADDRVTLTAPGRRTVAVDREQHERVGLALELVAGLRVVPLAEAEKAALAVVSAAPAKLPRAGILLIAPTEACCGLIERGPPRTVRDARIEAAPAPLPLAAVSGLTTFDLPAVRLPVQHRVLAAARSLKEGDALPLPLAAFWQWKRPVAYLGAVPEAWTAHPGFAVMVGELAERLLVTDTGLPDLRESDNRLQAAATRRAPKLYAGRTQARPVPLARWCALLAALLLGYALWAEWQRVRTRRIATRENTPATPQSR